MKSNSQFGPKSANALNSKNGKKAGKHTLGNYQIDIAQ